MSIAFVLNYPLPAAKAILKPTPPEIEAIMPDGLQAIADAVHALGNEAAALATMRELLARQAFNFFEQGAVLLRIKDKGWFGAYGSFEELCSAEFGFRKSKAYHLIAIYETLMGDNVPWTTVNKLGWCKLSLLCARRAAGELSAEAFSIRLEKAKTMTVVELRQSLMKVVDCGTPKANTSTYKPHEDQAETIAAAIDKAKKEAATEHDAVALELICGDYLAAPPKPGAAMPAGFATAVEKMDGPGGIEPAAPDIDDDLIMAWLQHAGPDKARELVEVALSGWTITKCAAS